MTFKKGDEVLIKGTVLSVEEGEILDLEIATSENTFFVNSEDVQMLSKVNQEQLYTVEVPNPHHDGITILEKIAGDIVMSQMDSISVDWQKDQDYQLTEAEIKKDFDWAWKWAKPVKE